MGRCRHRRCALLLGSVCSVARNHMDRPGWLSYSSASCHFLPFCGWAGGADTGFFTFFPSMQGGWVSK
jgi:hypothetical protein